jgi:hypothetical protein
MLGSIKSCTCFLFAGLNLLWIPIVFFYPETKDRWLESINAIFASSSPFHFALERSYIEQGDVIAMEGGREVVVRKLSVISIASEKAGKVEHCDI